MDSRPALVVGARGFVGSELSRRLADGGCPFLGVIRPGSTLPKPGHLPWPTGSFVEVDLLQTNAVVALVHRVQPSAIFNLAAVGVRRRPTTVEEFIAINVGLVAALVRVMPSDCVLVHAGSMFQYKPSHGPLNEDTAERERSNLYSWTKNVADELIDLTDVSRRCVRARLFGIVGHGESPDRLLPSIVLASINNVPVPLSDGQQIRDVLHVSDVAEALMHVSRTASLFGLAVNIGRGEGWTVRRIAETAASELDCVDRLQFGSRERRPAEGERYVADLTRLASTGWRPTWDFEESIRQAASELALEFRS